MKYPDSSNMTLALERAVVESGEDEDEDEEVEGEKRSDSMATRRPNSRSGILEAVEAACCIVVRVGMDSS